MSKLGEQSAGLYDAAVADRNAAQSLSEQAAEASAERDKIAASAEAAFGQAQQAADSAAAQVAEQSTVRDQLYAQLAVLKGSTADTEAAYYEGLEWERRQTEGTPPAVPPVIAPAPHRHPLRLRLQLRLPRHRRLIRSRHQHRHRHPLQRRPRPPCRPQTLASCRPRSTSPRRSWASRTCSAAPGRTRGTALA